MSRTLSKFAILGLSALTAATAAADNGTPAFGPGDIGSNGVTASPSSSLAWSNQLVTVDATTGAARASIPFELPTARGGVQPHLALNYSSDSGDGEAGAGWHLSLPSIERRDPSGGPSPTYVDQDPKVPTSDWDHFDRFVYNGQPLVPICSIRGGTCEAAASGETFPPFPATAGSGEWSYYRLQVDDGSAMRFFLSPNGLTWLVQAPRSGESLEFGNPLDGHSLGAPLDFGDTTHAFRWHLSRQYDNQRSATGPTNTIIYLWNNGVLSDIFDTPPAPTGTFGVGTGAFSVDTFAHHTHLWYRKNARYPSTAPAWRWLPDHILDHVDVSSMRWSNSGARELVRRYNLTYTGASAILDTVWGNHPTLFSVQLEGRCPAGPVLEAPLPSNAPIALNALPNADPGCPTLPATSMNYTPEAPSLQPAIVLTNGHGIAVD